MGTAHFFIFNECCKKYTNKQVRHECEHKHSGGGNSTDTHPLVYTVQ
jgi:hypothetical protein